VTATTDKIVPFSIAIQRVIGGKRQNMISIAVSPGIRGEDGIRVNSEAISIANGPRMYIPANTHPHLGFLFLSALHARSSMTRPNTETTFIATTLV